MTVDAGDGVVEVSAEEFKRLQEAAGKAEELGKRVDEFTRLEKFAEAGFDASNPTDRVFIKGYDGELTVEAIQSAATEAGWKFEQVVDGGGAEEGGKSWDSQESSPDGSEGVGPQSMKDALGEAARLATSQDDLNRRIIEVYRSYGEPVASDLE